ncbi:5549_t:CDS:2, partial [Paraglomus occultum]
EPPVQIASSSREQELLDRIASLEASINKSVHEFDVIVSPKRVKLFKWTVNIEHATLEALKDFIRAVYQTPALENDGAMFDVARDTVAYLYVQNAHRQVDRHEVVLHVPLPHRRQVGRHECVRRLQRGVHRQVDRHDNLPLHFQTQLAVRLTGA